MQTTQFSHIIDPQVLQPLLQLTLCSSSTIHVSDYTGLGSQVLADASVPQVYQLSYLYFSGLGALVGLLVGLVVSWGTGSCDLCDLDPRLVTPVMRRFLPQAPAPRAEEMTLISDRSQVKIVITEAEKKELV